MKLSDGAEALYEVFDRMEIEPSMADLEIVINTMQVVESKKKK